MMQETGEVDSLLLRSCQTSADQVLALLGNIPGEDQVSLGDLLVLLPGNVPLDHVVEEDP